MSFINFCNLDEQTSYCKLHFKEIENNENKAVQINNIIKEFDDVIEKMGKHLILIQEKDQLLRSDENIDLINDKDLEILHSLKETLKSKII